MIEQDVHPHAKGLPDDTGEVVSEYLYQQIECKKSVKTHPENSSCQCRDCAGKSALKAKLVISEHVGEKKNATWKEEGPEDGKFSDDKSDYRDENHSEAENDS